ncbi:MAG: hypothetical protein L6R41_007559, partial [Letrouitia leprolyta]
LLASEFFPKWHHVLYLWLTNEPNYEEIREWFLWWKDQFPVQIRGHEIVEGEWTKGLQTISTALELGPENVVAGLPPPAMGPVRPLTAAPEIRQQQQPLNGRAEEQGENIEPITFRAEVEAWCADNSLLFIPLREADPGSGLPLFRITASASGKGGAVVFLRGDVVWVREGKGSGAGFKPVGLEEGLLERAEGG